MISLEYTCICTFHVSGDEMNKFLDENWREVDGEIGARLGDATGLLITGILQGFMSKVPYTELFLV